MRSRTSRVLLGSMLCLLGLLTLGALETARGEELSRAAVAALAKPATVLVELKGGKKSGSGFCVDAAGLIVTNEHVVREVPEDGSVNVVIDAGQRTERVLKAVPVRRDKDLDLALLKVEGDHKLPPLAVGGDDAVAELTELIAFGFPFGTALAKPGEYPTITANVVNVSALRNDSNRTLHRIQLDSTLNPGGSGGPVLTREGKVAGVVVSTIIGAGINMAIPASHVRKFLDRPVLAFTPPILQTKDAGTPATFRATARILAGDQPELDVELVLASPGAEERRLPMALVGNEYRVDAVPFPGGVAEAQLNAELKFADGALSGLASDQEFKIGERAIKLSEISSLKVNAGEAEAIQQNGQRQAGPFVVPAPVTVRLAGKSFEVDLTSVKEARFSPQATNQTLACTVIVKRRGGDELGRIKQVLYPEGTQRPSLDSIKAEKYIRPPASVEASTYLSAISTPGDYIGQGAKMNHRGADVKCAGNDRLITVNVDGWTIQFAPPRGERLKTGEYLKARRYPFNDEAPGISFSGHGRGSNRVGGSFVIWELELEGDRVTRFAIDFVHKSEETGPPLYGMVRFNSLLQ